MVRRTHNLKILSHHFIDVVAGEKRAEVRVNDRDFKNGDYLNLQEFQKGIYTGDEHKVMVTHTLQGGEYGIERGYVVLSFIDANNVQKNICETSQVIKIKDRYFCGFGKKNRVMTAHCLTGATLYQDHSVIAVFDKLVGLNKKPIIIKIGEIVEPQNHDECLELQHQTIPVNTPTTQFECDEFETDTPF
jgi:hypothetical protein